MRAELKVGFNPQVEMGLTRSCKKWIWRVQRCEAPKAVIGGFPVRVCSDEDFLMRARVRGFDLACVWSALENLSGRKPQGLGGIYGERVLRLGV